jgi:hypothetical protein
VGSLPRDRSSSPTWIRDISQAVGKWVRLAGEGLHLSHAIRPAGHTAGGLTAEFDYKPLVSAIMLPYPLAAAGRGRVEVGIGLHRVRVDLERGGGPPARNPNCYRMLLAHSLYRLVTV